MTTQFVPQNSYTKEELLECGKGNLFGAGNAQLPLPNMLMIDRIISITEDGGKYGKGEIIAEAGCEGQVMSVRRDLDPVLYEVLFRDRMLLVPASALCWPPESEQKEQGEEAIC